MKRILRLNLHREFFAQIRFGWHGEKCALAVEKREVKLAVTWYQQEARAAMSVTTFEGVVENGQVRLAADICLPEKAKVYVVIPNVAVPPPAFMASPRLAHPKEAIAFKMEVIPEAPYAGV